MDTPDLAAYLREVLHLIDEHPQLARLVLLELVDEHPTEAAALLGLIRERFEAHAEVSTSRVPLVQMRRQVGPQRAVDGSEVLSWQYPRRVRRWFRKPPDPPPESGAIPPESES